MNLKLLKTPLVLKTGAVIACLVILGIVGTTDYYAGYEYSFSIFYLIAIIFGFWLVGLYFALSLAVVSSMVAIIGDIAAGARYSSDFVTIWILIVRLTFYFIIIWLLSRLRAMQDALEAKVMERTAALTAEMAQREILERDLLAVSEKEQHRLGHELHDSLCQHLTGTALAGQVLVRKMSARSLPEADELKHVVELVENGITLARNTARGLFPVEFDSAGLMSALAELATSKTKRFGIDCRFECRAPVLIDNTEVSAHLYRIAQEAVRNAAAHARATRVVITFDETDDGVLLEVSDNGKGFDVSAADRGGMGLRIMKYRASMIGASFEITSGPSGTTVACRLGRPMQAVLL